MEKYQPTWIDIMLGSVHEAAGILGSSSEKMRNRNKAFMHEVWRYHADQAAKSFTEAKAAFTYRRRVRSSAKLA